jgi:type IV pilus assembly protein PilA
MAIFIKLYTKSGFSLVELMIVIAIIGILTSIAIPSYQNTINKAKILEATTLMHKVRLSINEYALYHNGTFTNATNDTLKLTHVTDGAKYVKSIITRPIDTHTIDILVTLNDNLGTLTYKGQYLLQNGRIKWQCHFDNNSPIANYAPKNCTASQA